MDNTTTTTTSNPTPTSTRRSRVIKTCEPCSKKKRKCDGVRPICSRCLKTGNEIQCVYPPLPDFNRASRPGRPAKTAWAQYADSLRGRIREVEARLSLLGVPVPPFNPTFNHNNSPSPGIKNEPDDHTTAHLEFTSGGSLTSPTGFTQQQQQSPSITTATISPSRYSSEPESATSSIVGGGRNSVGTSSGGGGVQGGARSTRYSITSSVIQLSEGVPVDEFGNFGGGSGVDMESMLPGIPVEPIERRGLVSKDVFDSLPQSSLDELIDLFFGKLYHVRPYSFLHPTIFRRNLRSHSPFLLETLYAYTARYSSDPTIVSWKIPGADWSAGEPFFYSARSRMSEVLDGPPSLETVQALMFLGCYAFQSGRASTGWQYWCIMTCMAQELQLHVDPDINCQHMSWYERETRRRTWWLIWEFDREIPIFVRRPKFIQSFPSLKIPVPEVAWLSISDPTQVPPSNALVIGEFPLGDPLHAIIRMLQLMDQIVESVGSLESDLIAATLARGTYPFTMTKAIPQLTNPAYHAHVARVDFFESACLEFRSGLPPWMAEPPSSNIVYHPGVISTRDHQTWTTVQLHIMLLGCQVMMRLPQAVVAFVNYSAHVDPSVAAIAGYVGEVVRILQDVVAVQNPGFHHIHNLVALSLHSCGVAAAMISRVTGFEDVAKGIPLLVNGLHSLGCLAHPAMRIKAALGDLWVSLGAVGGPGQKNAIQNGCGGGGGSGMQLQVSTPAESHNTSNVPSPQVSGWSQLSSPLVWNTPNPVGGGLQDLNRGVMANNDLGFTQIVGDNYLAPQASGVNSLPTSMNMDSTALDQLLASLYAEEEVNNQGFDILSCSVPGATPVTGDVASVVSANAPMAAANSVGGGVGGGANLGVNTTTQSWEDMLKSPIPFGFNVTADAAFLEAAAKADLWGPFGLGNIGGVQGGNGGDGGFGDQ
ncbi:hypothetical protein HDU76_000375 [Blyttiomyces sp. JEL0837]|nr:hypothetical protein HDU76_000375 [Blyttiomyces sp. JEL0837]